MADSPDLAVWLSACFDAAEQAARDAGEPSGGRWQADGCGVETAGGVDWQRVVYDEGRPTVEEARHIAALDPSWRLGDIARKRLILAEHVHEPVKPDSRGGPDFGCITCHSQGYDGETLPWGWCRTVLLLAAEFEASPGFVEAWRP